jgi:hypothetical protein
MTGAPGHGDKRFSVGGHTIPRMVSAGDDR